MLHFLHGDATRPRTAGPKIITHLCNDRGRWGKGFVLALSARWPEPERAYREWAEQGSWEGEPFGLGGAQLVEIPHTDIAVVNLVAQHGLKAREGVPPIRYGALETSLHKLQMMANRLKASIHMPRLGCGLAGGDWERIEPLLNKLLWDFPVYVYDLNQRARPNSIQAGRAGSG
ncbi:MAG: Appr-1-p processing protein [Candidatus Eremiobacteraeota bacterium]|nr:Appr-1-p processing protein [Candidatus Eremiobacteraeota bacterium]MCW5866812.1 Appr-1-p processing protein [Candidatus Eremiobacteraeota bacterium]